jgi:hypothetical protein
MYDKEMIDVVIKYQTNKGETLLKDKSLKLQIGSKFNLNPERILADSKKLYWEVSKECELDVIISPEREKNIYTVVYDEYLANVFDRFINEETGDELIEPNILFLGLKT